LAANKPVLALTRGTAAARIVMETGVGWVVSPDKPEEIADAIETIIRHAGKIVAVRNEAFITAFSRDSQMAALALKLKGL
jgi:glycosyltransferase involved in cell wall biosynthesis